MRATYSKGVTGLERTQAARDAARDKQKLHGLERYCLTLYLEPGQVEYLRALPSLERSSTIRAALKALGTPIKTT